MLIAIAYCLRDQDITLKLFEWIKEFGGCQKHSLLLCHDARCNDDNVVAISKISRECFGTVHEITAKAEIDGWPAGANYMFQLCATWASYQPSLKYFLWIEPDAIPLKTGWLNAIEAEYLKAGKPFMGDRVEVADVPLHLSGIAVYPNPLVQFAGLAMISHDVAWDVAAAGQIVTRSHWTKLIEHSWRHPAFTNSHELETQIRPEAVLFHSSKDGSLINLLRDERNKKLSDVQDKPIGESVSPTDLQREIGMEKLPYMSKQKSGRVEDQNEEISKIQIEPTKMGESSHSGRDQNWKNPKAKILPEVQEPSRFETTSRSSPGLPQKTGSSVALSGLPHSGTQVTQRSGSRAATNISTPGGENPPPLTENLSGGVESSGSPAGDTHGATTSRTGTSESADHRSSAQVASSGSSAPPAQISCDIFIRTYAQDYPWLEYCLQSIHKFASGFRKIVIVSPHGPPMVGHWDMHDVEWKVLNEESADGYLSQQIHKLYADVITDYQPEYILHIDSDVILTQPITPQSFFSKPDGEGLSITFSNPRRTFNSSKTKENKLIWYYTPYEAIKTPWKPVTEKFMNHPVANEFMRRLPIMIPRWLYANLREFCYSNHGKRIISEYIRNQPPREFSEFNALGAFAYEKFRDRFEWINTLEVAIPGPVGRQFHSWKGLTPEIRSEIQTILNAVPVLADSRIETTGSNRTLESGEARALEERERESTTKRHSLEAKQTLTEDSRGGVQKIKVLPNDIWVIEGDQISQWVEETGRLDHDQNLLPKILPYIHEGDTVIDVGAFIGDHTVAYAKAVGKKGLVYAFEPNPIAYQCLVQNVRNLKNTISTDAGLSDRREIVSLSGNNGNYGGCYVGKEMPVNNVPMWPLDQEQDIDPNFIKIDVEGYELKVLRGAEQTINICRPTMVIEINYGALKRQGARPEDIFKWLLRHGYNWTILQENCDCYSDLYDILAKPKKEGDATCPETLPRTTLRQSGAAPKVQSSGAAGFDPAIPGGDSVVISAVYHNRTEAISGIVAMLKNYCTSPVHTSQVRKELKRQKVIK